METEVLSLMTVRTTHRSSNGCWTCRLRRKKCDEQHPVCAGCDALNLTCYYGQEKPSWMDGGEEQDKMAALLKRKVKERGHRRIGNYSYGDRNGLAGVANGGTTTAQGQRLPSLPAALDALDTTPDVSASSSSPSGAGAESSFSQPLDADSPRRRASSCKLAPTNVHRDSSLSAPFDDNVLIMFYIEHVMPFLFPFYRPPLLQGGRGWILDMMTNSPIVRRAALCQSSYFFSILRGTANDDDPLWETVLAQTREAFGVLGKALAVISGSDITEHLHGAVRVMSGIIQVQRFEIAISSFGNCQSHLNAALALFQQILDSVGPTDPTGFNSSFEAVMYKLSLPSWSYALNGQLPSAEQAAFRFSSALLFFDDIVASTILQEQPRLYGLHQSLLEDLHGNGPVIDLEAIIGCQNWALVQIAEIAVLDAWKQRCKSRGTLNVMELVRRATPIKTSLETHLARVNSGAATPSNEGNGIFDVFTTNDITAGQKPLITRAWAHAALIYLSVVVSGWQPASPEILNHATCIIRVLVHELTPPALLRTIVWPLSVAGCLADPELASQLWSILEGLQPRSVFGTITKALEVMRSVWYSGNAEDLANRDLASCFRNMHDLVLLV
ncbi:fungal-specific transcription factor domain-containing protein [Xylaria telfairii]|nr:fungal-specific transcription factor domain-containing protein [Xylaria telfairii]